MKDTSRPDFKPVTVGQGAEWEKERTQSFDSAALDARTEVESGAMLTRLLTREDQVADGAQFWSMDPSDKLRGQTVEEFNRENGIIGDTSGSKNLDVPFILTGRLKDGSNFVTTEAEAAYNSSDKLDKLEVVSDPGGVEITGGFDKVAPTTLGDFFPPELKRSGSPQDFSLGDARANDASVIQYDQERRENEAAEQIKTEAENARAISLQEQTSIFDAPQQEPRIGFADSQNEERLVGWESHGVADSPFEQRSGDGVGFGEGIGMVSNETKVIGVGFGEGVGMVGSDTQNNGIGFSEGVGMVGHDATEGSVGFSEGVGMVDDAAENGGVGFSEGVGTHDGEMLDGGTGFGEHVGSADNEITGSSSVTGTEGVGMTGTTGSHVGETEDVKIGEPLAEATSGDVTSEGVGFAEPSVSDTNAGAVDTPAETAIGEPVPVATDSFSPQGETSGAGGAPLDSQSEVTAPAVAEAPSTPAETSSAPAEASSAPAEAAAPAAPSSGGTPA